MAGTAAVYAQCPAPDQAAVQKALDDAGTAGGGVVSLEARAYEICQPLIVPSNVHLRGAGRGATIIRGAAGVVPNCPVVSNSPVCAAIGVVGANNVTVSNLSIDLKTNNYDANGIEFVPADSPGPQPFDSQVVTNGEVDHVEVLGAPGFHAYMIWNLRGQHIKITNNWVDGGSSSDSFQEGIETYGGHDVMIANNTVQNIGDACINLDSAGLPNTESIGLSVFGNYIANGHYGIHVGTASLDESDQYNSQTEIRGNIITSGRLIGIDVAVMAETHLRDLDISNNSINGISAEFLAAGILLSTPSGPVTTDEVTNVVLDGNTIGRIHGPNGQGIRVGGCPNVRVLNNSIADTDDAGIYAVDAVNLEVVRNRVARSKSAGIIIQKSYGSIATLDVERNSVIDWLNGPPAILIVGAHNGAVRDNTFQRSDTATPLPLVVYGSCGMTVSGSLAWYLRGWEDVSTGPCP